MRLIMIKNTATFAGFIVLLLTGTYLTTKYAENDFQRRSSGDDAGKSSEKMRKEGKVDATSLSSKANLPASNPLPGKAKIAVKLVTNLTKLTNTDNNTFHLDTQEASINSTVMTSNVSVMNFSTPSSKVITINTTIPTNTPTITTSNFIARNTSTPATTQATTTGIVNIENSTTATTKSISDSVTSSYNLHTITMSLNETNNSTTNGTLTGSASVTKGLSPVLTTVVAIGCGLVLIVVIFVAIKIFKNVKTFRFSRLHEMPMDDFDDYSGVYAEHTVPIRPSL